MCIGCEVSKEDVKVLALPPNFAITPKLDEKDFREQMEISHTKLRYAAMSETKVEGENDEVEELKPPEKEMETREHEAEARMVFDRGNKSIDLRNKRVTDFSSNSSVYLPPPLVPLEETVLATRSDRYIETLKDFKKQPGNQCCSIENSFSKGIKSLQQRTKSGEDMVLQTDKSGKNCIVSTEKVLEMGKIHTQKDREISWAEAEKIQSKLNGHVSCWIKMTRLGEAWKHSERMRESLIHQSCVVPEMCLLVQDHKPVEEGQLPPTRPVVAACTGMNTP